MKMKRMRTWGSGLVLLSALCLAPGCGGQKDKTDKVDKTDKTDKTDKDGHGAHGAGPKGGTLSDWGGGEYHVEFTVDHDKKEATVYIYGKDEKTPAPIKAKDGEILLTIDEPAFKLSLKASPQPKDPAGTASCFVNTHKNLGIVQEFSGTITGVVDGTPYTGKFKEEPAKK